MGEGHSHDPMVRCGGDLLNIVDSLLVEMEEEEKREGEEGRRRRGRRRRRRGGERPEGGGGREAVPKLLSEFVPDYENTVLNIFLKGVDLRKRNSPNVMESIAR